MPFAVVLDDLGVIDGNVSGSLFKISYRIPLQTGLESRSKLLESVCVLQESECEWEGSSPFLRGFRARLRLSNDLLFRQLRAYSGPKRSRSLEDRVY